MFYCNACGNHREWPTDTFVKSFGNCEICGVRCMCNDVPSKDLPECPEYTINPQYVSELLLDLRRKQTTITNQARKLKEKDELIQLLRKKAKND